MGRVEYPLKREGGTGLLHIGGTGEPSARKLSRMPSRREKKLVILCGGWYGILEKKKREKIREQ